MNKAKLEIVRLNNEDVIATSCSKFSPAKNDNCSRIVHVSESGVSFGIGQSPDTYTIDQLSNDVIIKESGQQVAAILGNFIDGKHYHIDGDRGEDVAMIWVECNIEAHREENIDVPIPS